MIITLFRYSGSVYHVSIFSEAIYLVLLLKFPYYSEKKGSKFCIIMSWCKLSSFILKFPRSTTINRVEINMILFRLFSNALRLDGAMGSSQNISADRYQPMVSRTRENQYNVSNNKINPRFWTWWNNFE